MGKRKLKMLTQIISQSSEVLFESLTAVVLDSEIYITFVKYVVVHLI